MINYYQPVVTGKSVQRVEATSFSLGKENFPVDNSVSQMKCSESEIYLTMVRWGVFKTERLDNVFKVVSF